MRFNFFKPKQRINRFVPTALQDQRFHKFEVRIIENEATQFTHFDGHYIYHPAWAARILRQTMPPKHIDISSTLSFSTLLSAFIPVDFYDYRPAKISLSNLESRRADLTSLAFDSNSIRSLSCMHTVEHIGLGRYGDPIDPNGDLKAISELKRVSTPGGDLLFVVPVGRPKLVFNAHRIYSFAMISDYFKGWILRDFSLVDDLQNFHNSATEELANLQEYGCGCFWWQKPFL